MNEKKYRLAFSGRLAPGFDPQRLERDLSGRMGPAQGARIAAVLQQGKRVIVAKGLTLTQAESLQHRLLDLGLDVTIEDPTPVPTPRPVSRPHTPSPADNGNRSADTAPGRPTRRPEGLAPRGPAAATCPSCGAPRSAASGVRCKRCGAYFHRRDAHLAAQAAPTLDRETLTEKATELASGHFLDWLKSQGKLALIALVLIPVFGSGIALRTFFVTKDHHVAYETEAWKVGCIVLDDEWHMPTTNRGKQLMATFLETYKDEEVHPSDLYDIYGPRICMHEYNLELGNIGEEPMPKTTISLDTDAIVDGFLDEDPAAHADIRVEDLFAGDPRSGDPVIDWSEDGTAMEVRNLPVGTYLELRFHTWYPEGEPTADWDRLLVSIDVSDGSLDYASPRATMLGRILGDIF